MKKPIIKILLSVVLPDRRAKRTDMIKMLSMTSDEIRNDTYTVVIQSYLYNHRFTN